MTAPAYSSPEAFKQALEQRLRSSTSTGADFARKRQLLVFDRFLARAPSRPGALATTQSLEATRLRTAITQTFGFRRTHAVPAALPAPLPAWAAPYAAMAREDRLPWPTLGEVTAAVQAFLDPVLATAIDAAWQPERWIWQRR